MLEVWKSLIKSEKAVKAVFDYYKNFIVAAVIVGLGLKLWPMDVSGAAIYIGVVFSILLLALGIFLLVLNICHAFYLFDKTNLTKCHRRIILALDACTWVLVFGFSVWPWPHAG